MLALVFFIFLAIMAATFAGLLIKLALDAANSNKEITWTEFVVVLLIASPILAVIVGFCGWKMGVSNVMQFNEHWNGWELVARKEVTGCAKDGACYWDYNCDPYYVTVTKCSGTGDDRKCWPELEKRYHHCPVTTEEWQFYVNTTLGTYTIGTHWLPYNPESHRWSGVGYDGTKLQWALSRGAQVGEPEFWLGVLARTQNNTVPGGPVSDVRQYDNFILASQNTLLKAYSSDIKRFLGVGLLPPMNYAIHNHYWTDKVHFIGFTPENQVEWQMAFHYLAAALGTDREGDPRLVIVQSDEASANPDAYILALKAYWQTPEWENEEGKMVTLWGDNCFSKNGVMIVVGTKDGKTVDWARLQTTMPQGNEWLEDSGLINRRLKGLPLTPEVLIGTVRGEYYMKEYTDGRPPKQKVRANLDNAGVLSRLLFAQTPEGDSDQNNRGFVRVSMSGDDPDDVGTGYLFLKGEIQPTKGQKVAIIVFTFILCMVAWFVVAAVGERAGRGRYSRSGYYY